MFVSLFVCQRCPAKTRCSSDVRWEISVRNRFSTCVHTVIHTSVVLPPIPAAALRLRRFKALWDFQIPLSAANTRPPWKLNIRYVPALCRWKKRWRSIRCDPWPPLNNDRTWRLLWRRPCENPRRCAPGQEIGRPCTTWKQCRPKKKKKKLCATKMSFWYHKKLIKDISWKNKTITDVGHIMDYCSQSQKVQVQVKKVHSKTLCVCVCGGGVGGWVGVGVGGWVTMQLMRQVRGEGEGRGREEEQEKKSQ